MIFSILPRLKVGDGTLSLERSFTTLVAQNHLNYKAIADPRIFKLHNIICQMLGQAMNYK